MQQIKEILRQLSENRLPPHVFRPVFFNLNEPSEAVKFSQSINHSTVLCDEIESQVADFIKKRNPSKKFSTQELEFESQQMLGENPELFGLWVFYPWSNRMVHVLPEKMFVEVRTSRNHYKITPQEQAQLACKIVGVIGLSVGQSVAVTMAMERTCGELRLADFDALELTNLNRIRTGIHNLGVPKVVSVAREISEIDPFIKVKIFPQGLNESNMDEYLLSDGKMDLLIEESDGFDIKILSRIRARQLRIPVLMEASDRCMVDVERFDLEPNRDILHGLVNHLNVEELKRLKTTEEKIPYMMDILGLETASTRLKASMLEIEQTINTWPQLASAVTMGGGITTDVARRILLSKFLKSGRFFVDVEEIISDNPTSLNKQTKGKDIRNEFSFEMAMQNIPAQLNKPSLSIDREKITALVNSACLAPSGGNSQPWRWIFTNNTLFLFNPFPPSATLLDFNGAASQIAMGAALENIVTLAQSMCWNCHFTYNQPKNIHDWLVAVNFAETTIVTEAVSKRVPAIYFRNTNRKISPRTSLDSFILNKIKLAAEEINGATVEFLVSEQDLKDAGEILSELEKIRILDSSGHRDFVNEMRWTDEESKSTGDGVDIKTVDITNSELAGFKIARDKGVIELVSEWNGGDAFKKLTKKGVDGAGAVGILYISREGESNYLEAGRALEKIWLETNLNGIALHPVSACLFLYERLFKGNGQGLDAKTIAALKQIRPAFEKIFCRKNGFKEMFIFRLTNCGEAEVKSLRKPLEQVFQLID